MSLDEIKLKVPYFSQNRDISEDFWKNKSCGIVCLKMALDFLEPENQVKLDDLLSEGQIIEGYKNGLWLHDSICRLARNHGLLAYAQEFRSIIVDLEKKEFSLNESAQEIFFQEMLKKILEQIKKQLPVIISVAPGFSSNKQSHMVLIMGVKIENGEVVGLFVHDPDDRENQSTESILVDLENFRKYWRRLAIFFEKTGLYV